MNTATSPHTTTITVPTTTTKDIHHTLAVGDKFDKGGGRTEFGYRWPEGTLRTITKVDMRKGVPTYYYDNGAYDPVSHIDSQLARGNYKRVFPEADYKYNVGDRIAMWGNNNDIVEVVARSTSRTDGRARYDLRLNDGHVSEGYYLNDPEHVLLPKVEHAYKVGDVIVYTTDHRTNPVEYTVVAIDENGSHKYKLSWICVDSGQLIGGVDDCSFYAMPELTKKVTPSRFKVGDIIKWEHSANEYRVTKVRGDERYDLVKSKAAMTWSDPVGSAYPNQNCVNAKLVAQKLPIGKSTYDVKITVDGDSTWSGKMADRIEQAVKDVHREGGIGGGKFDLELTASWHSSTYGGNVSSSTVKRTNRD